MRAVAGSAHVGALATLRDRVDVRVRAAVSRGHEVGVARGAARHVRGAQRLELPAQHRHDLLTEQVDLLEHRLQGQARVVDEEQLALVVTDVVAEAERPLDDLLG